MNDSQPRPYWSSLTSYLLVTTGAVVGLGNIIRFPFYIYKFGGMFFLLYILCELFICIPLLLAELSIGRRGKQNPVGSFAILSMETGANRKWRLLGWLCFIILFFSLVSYSVAVSFPTLFFVNMLSVHASPASLSTISNKIIALEICLLVFLFVTMLVILRGINRGLETISRITVPFYFFILLGLAIYSCSTGNLNVALNRLLDFSWQDSFTTVFSAALTYAFFKLNIGMGCMIVYGSYLPYSVPIGRSTLLIICFDAIISLLAYFVVCPLFTPHSTSMGVLSYQETFYYFLQTSHGYFIALCFFLAAIVAAWTPTIAMAESATLILIERFDLSRRFATCLIFAGGALLSAGILIDYYRGGNAIIFDQSKITQFIDQITTTVFIPISAFLTALFAGWIVKRHITESELRFTSRWYTLWRFLIRWIAPIFIIITALMLWNIL